jgi:23S rRNA (guanine2445-N2)-methyltransferase / 23S rRNA (guanine2069-N7)-methyltransferase
VHLRTRAPQKAGRQYGKARGEARLHPVGEGAVELLVDLEKYLDTGLFLDHRDTRRLVGQLAEGRHMLNLFGYTGTASCYAASGGARSTTTIDLSKTYLDWAQRNLSLNGFGGKRHQMIQADCLDWLAKARAYQGYFGLIFLDPPTFSTSKRMRRSFDVERDQVALIRAALMLLEPNGELIFSTNKRRFRLADQALRDVEPALVIDDISAQTLPKDFGRNPHIHRCWRIRWR